MIGIVGAGPGGLTAAIALRKVGFEVEVLERAPDVRPVGAGLTVQVNAMRMFESIGLADAIRDAGHPLKDGRLARRDGSTLAMMDVDGPWSHTGIGILRGRLSALLLDALPDGTVHCGVAIANVREDGTVIDDAGNERQYDAVIGADGIHSAVRQALFGDKPLRYAGYTCWRGIAPLASDTLCERWGPGRRFGNVPVDADTTYWFATDNAPAGGKDGPNPIAELRARFADFEPHVDALLQATPEVLRHDLYDLRPLDRWTKGRVTLLGDAAHAMTPNLGQGACQAIEDAIVLADALASHGVPDGLEAYEARRKQRALDFVNRSWRIGAVGQWSNPLACWARNLSVAWTPPGVMARQLEAVYDVEVPTLTR